jgi:hypothetical protein
LPVKPAGRQIKRRQFQLRYGRLIDGHAPADHARWIGAGRRACGLAFGLLLFRAKGEKKGKARGKGSGSGEFKPLKTKLGLRA